MSERKYVLGIDFGTESARVLLVDAADGTEVSTVDHLYASGVIDTTLPATGKRLEPDWALQDPHDYLDIYKTAVPQAVKQAKIDPKDVIGIGVDFTVCTMLPTLKDGTPLCFVPGLRDNPHAWVKLWKHHAAEEEANRLTDRARELGYDFIDRYGGKINSEWIFPKIWQILNEAPEIYDAADRFIEAADWAVWMLVGKEKRNSCAAGYKEIWSKSQGYPPNAFFKALDPRLENVVDEKMSRQIYPLGSRAGGLTREAAEWMGLAPGTAVAVAIGDAHASVPGSNVVEPGRMVIIMGTSNCHMLLSEKEIVVPGISGYAEDGIVPGYIAYEAGQSCVGDHFAWFVDTAVPWQYHEEAEKRGISLYQLLEEKTARLKPGESGIVALDWWNGNRNVLADFDLTGMLVGMTLTTKPEEIYRALIEATAFGTRVIIETFDQHQVPVNEIVATGGLPNKNRLLMQIYADITGRELKVAASSQTGALGAAMYGAVAAGSRAGGYDTIQAASRAMSHLQAVTYKPDRQAVKVYDLLYKEYLALHDYFGRGQNDVMKRLKQLRATIIRQSG